MTPVNDFPPLDFEHSRFTGWTRAHSQTTSESPLWA